MNVHLKAIVVAAFGIALLAGCSQKQEAAGPAAAPAAPTTERTESDTGTTTTFPADQAEQPQLADGTPRYRRKRR